MSPWLTVFLGAGLGGALRHGVNVAAARLLGMAFPFGTLTVNVLGRFAMGVLVGVFARVFDPGQTARLFLTTGVLGGFTTFSAFSLDAAVLRVELSRPGLAPGQRPTRPLGRPLAATPRAGRRPCRVTAPHEAVRVV